MTNVVAFPHEKLRKHLIKVLQGFDNDPADTPFQEGYEDAMRELYRVFFGGRS